MIYQMLKKDFLIFFVIYLIFVIGFSQGKWTLCRIHFASSLIDKLSNRTDSYVFLDLLKITSLINWTLSVVLFFLPLLLRKLTTYQGYYCIVSFHMCFYFYDIFSAMFLVMRGYEDSTIQENLFTRWFAAGLGVIILSLGEFEVYFHFLSIAIAAISLS